VVRFEDAHSQVGWRNLCVIPYFKRGLSLELKDYLRVLRRNWLVLVVATLVGVFVAGGISLLIKPKYVSETKLFVALQNSSSVSELQQGNIFTQARVRSYVGTGRLATGDRQLRPVGVPSGSC
jgi:hypothetical protein